MASEIPLAPPIGMSKVSTMNTPTPAPLVPVTVREVGLRDGLQILPRTLPTAHKLEWIRGAYDAGLREIEVGSFVPPKLMPQLADTAELVAFAKTLPGLLPSVLVPNLKGAERAIESGAHALLLPLSASHAHSLANLRKTPDEVVDEIAPHRRPARRQGFALPGRGGHLHRLRLHDPGPRRTGRGAAPGARGARCRRRPHRPGRHRGVCRSAAGEDAVRAGPRSCRRTDLRAATSTTRAASAWPTCSPPGRPACAASTPAPAASAAARTRRAPAATWPPKTWPTCSPAWACPLACDFNALMALRERVARWIEGEPLHGAIWRAGLPKTVAA